MLGEILSGGAGLIGAGVNYLTAKQNRDKQSDIAQANIAQQREFAQNGLRWKVEDAKRAGIHPLFALGASTNSFSPVSVGSGSDSSVGDAIASAGQNIGRAAQAGMTQGERDKTAMADKLTLEKAGLENELLRTQIVSLKRAQLAPAMPTLGKTPAGFDIKTDDIKQTPDEVSQSKIHRPLGYPIYDNPYFSGAQHAEDAYGNAVEEAAGIGKLVMDHIYSIPRWLKGPKASWSDMQYPIYKKLRGSQQSRW